MVPGRRDNHNGAIALLQFGWLLFARLVPENVQNGVSRRQGHERLPHPDLVGQQLNLGPRLKRSEKSFQELVHRGGLTPGVFVGHTFLVTSQVHYTVKARDHRRVSSVRESGSVAARVDVSFRTMLAHCLARGSGSEA